MFRERKHDYPCEVLMKPSFPKGGTDGTQSLVPVLTTFVAAKAAYVKGATDLVYDGY